MITEDFLQRLSDNHVGLSVDGDELVVRTQKQGLDPALVGMLRENKQALLELVRAGAYPPAAKDQPKLAALDPAEAALIAERVPGGAANVQDVYPLAPLQEGILFHSLMAKEGDPYLLLHLFSVDSRERLDAFIAALRAVTLRHDILRTAVVWEGLREPMQVVWRQAPLRLEEVEIDPAGDPREELWRRFDARHYRIDVQQAPMLELHVARDAEPGRWLLLLVRHHLTSDHVSVGTLVGEVRAHMMGTEATLAPSVPFRNFVAQTRLGAGKAAHEAFFRKLLGDVDEPTAPFGLLDVSGGGPKAVEARILLEPELVARMQVRARASRVSTASICHLAWALVLARVSGRTDVVFGTVLFGRMSGGAGAERAMGPYINTLPVRVQAAAGGVEAGLRRMHTLLAELLQHEHASLALAQRSSGVPAPTPLFSALLNYRHSAKHPPAEAGSAWSGVQLVQARTRTNYPLMMSIDEMDDRFLIAARVVGSVDAEQVVELMHTALGRIVDALETAPTTPLERLDILPAAERQRVVEAWNDTGVAYPDDACAHELFEARAERTPHAVAVEFEDERVTFAELNRRANRLAHHLRGVGVGPDTRVALYLERSVEMVVGLLGVLKAGGAYVPLDPAYPADRLGFMLHDSAPAALLTHNRMQDRLAAPGIPVFDLVADAGQWAGQPATNPERGELTPEHLVYAMYTSGSTGQPKGVMLEHRGVVNRLFAMQGECAIGAGDALLQKTPYGFDVSFWEFFWPLMTGARLVMARPLGHTDPDYLVDVIRRAGITGVHFVPSMLPLFLDHPEAKTCTGLRWVACSGEALLPALAHRFHQSLPETELWNWYGPTETGEVTAWRCPTGPLAARVPMGRPIQNTQLYVLDGAGGPVPVAASGELYLAGVSVARGYLNRPRLTAERFVPDPFAGAPGARMYRTGDLARWLPDGTAEFLGRNDFQVKIRGNRVELGEVEARLAEHPAVREAAVVARADVPGDPRLVGYFVGDVEVAAVRDHLAGLLPAYMVPTAFVRLDALPLTPNGKTDRRALPAPEGGAYTAHGYEAPLGDTEVALAEIWADVLRLDRVSRRDHFFEVGGHSLLAVQVISRVKRVFEADVALSDVFDRPVLADFAHALEEAAHAALPPIEPVDRAGPLPLSFAQQRLWFLEEMGGVGSAYHIRRQLRFGGELDRDAMQRALDRIVARHEALRTTFVVVGGEPVQRIGTVEESAFALLHHDLRGHPDAARELPRIVAEEASAPFDLLRGPLIRGRLVRLADADHVLLLTMHHVVSDAWSMGVLVRELSALYAACRAGGEDPLGPLPVQYADYAAWQRKWVHGEVLSQQVEYWKTTLGGAPELLELPADRARGTRQDFAGDAFAVILDEELTAALKALGQRHGTTLFMTLLAGWATLLGRLAGQDDVVIGTPTANRGRQEIEGLIGFFVNTLALRVDLGGSPTVAELLRRVKARALGAQHHQDIPFEQVVELLHPARSLAHSPLFQVMFSWQNAPPGGLELPGLELGAVERAAQDTAKFDISMSLREAGGRIIGGITYATSLFERATAERYAGYFVSLLRQMVADDAAVVDRLALLPGDERTRLVEEWNATEAEYPRDLCIHELIEAQTERTPAAVAAVFGDAELTYAELNARANRLAHHLRGLGVGPDARVAICLGRSLELLVAVLAVLKAGGAYVPLDPSYPADRLRFMLDDSAPVVVLTERSLELDHLFRAVPTLHVDAPSWAGEPAGDPLLGALTRDHLAYVIYTSGSTGRPKGVMVPHGGLTHYAWWARRQYAHDAPRTFALYSSVAFDLTVTSIFVPLISGGTAVVYGAEEGTEPSVLRVVEDDRVDVAKLTPSHLMLMDGRGLAGRRIGTMVVGGEELKTRLARSVVEGAGGRLAVYNEYGPTEAVVGCMIHRFDPEHDHAAAVPIGRPIDNTRIYILDRRGDPVPIGVTGELFVGGAQVTRGYLGRPELTAERFVADAFGAEPGARLYRTGDLARWRVDGVAEYLGRNDSQVKVRGFRIELGEIEARLAEHGAVREAVVVAREDTPGNPRLVAYYVGVVDAAVLRLYLMHRLPAHMVPAAYMELHSLPLTPNGKTDRRALPAPDGEAYARGAHEAPVGDAEVVLAEIWADVLKVDHVGRWDNFFEVGGHSLLAVQVISRVREVLSVEVSLGDVFARPVLHDFAYQLETARHAVLPAIERADRSAPLPLSFAQQRLWFLEEMGGLGSTYHVPRRLRLTGTLDREALTRALDRIVERHESLRTTFGLLDGAPVQRIAAEARTFTLVEHDIRTKPNRDEALHYLVVEETRAPFDLERGPLVRGRLVHLGTDDHVLLVTMHHIVSDGWSVGVFVRELSALYGAFRMGQADPLPPLPLQYADYAAWQRRYIDGPVLEAQVEYWRDTMAGVPEIIELPTDRPRPAQQDYTGAVVHLALSEELSAGLKAMSRRHATTLFTTLMAGWAVVLGRLSGQDDVVVGIPTANRGRTEIERLIGFFVNTLAVRVELGDAPTVARLLDRVKERTLGAQQHQDLPFEQVVELVRPTRSLSHHPLFQVLFAWQNTPGGRTELPGLTMGGVGAPSQDTAKFDLSLSLQEAGGRIAGGITYATALFNRATVERYVGYFVRVLEQMVADDTRAVAGLTLLAPDERTQVLEGWNDTAAAYPGERPVHELFAARAAGAPHAVAVVGDDETLTYGELNARANRLAHHLRGMGVGPETRVAICVERGAEMMVGMMGVLKAGGAYVPLDPSHPADRLRFVLDDSAPVAVLTQRALRGHALFAGAEVPVLFLDAPSWNGEPATDPAAFGLAPEHPAYVMYTSGSTGRPKGVVVPHGGVVNLLWSIRATVGMDQADRVLAVTTYAFDISVLELFLPLVCGARAVVLGRELSGDPARLAEAIRAHAPTVMQATPALWRMLVESGWEGAGELRALCGGEALPAELAAGVRSRVAALWNVYGPTETTIWSSARPVERAGGPVGAQVPIGRPVANTRIHVLDARGEPVPVGVAGELYIGGAGVTRGYLHQPGLTAERYLADPFGAEPGARLYRTGDLARRLADGTLEYLGRTDFQVKVRGYRIELGEIEARLAEHPELGEAVVMARDDARGDRRLVAYYVGGEGVNVDDLRAHLAARLPEYMVPAAYVRLDALPLTANGKLDRRALPAPDDDAYGRRAHEAPVGEVEIALAEIWRELLDVEEVGRGDHFFTLGGHSLLAVRLIERMRQRRLRMGVRALFTTSSLAELATTVREIGDAEVAAEARKSAEPRSLMVTL
ncbi:MAG TPA: amino acid adenylation domain-containing protein [Longimicrobium sp.]|nr:amino acid adenylation domain-containing protein [Longimicrobium sp.]